MRTIIHKANSRGYFDHGWLKTNHTFSFARYYDPERVHFGALRVLNDDVINAGEGFGKHPHDNMEIITIPLQGAVLHRDSMGNEEIINAGEVQVMSAGTGIFHEEYNASKDEVLTLLQIWIFPETKNIKPSYSQKLFDAAEAENKWQKMVSRNDPTTLHIHQNASISRTFLKKGNALDYEMKKSSYGTYVFIVEGEAEVAEINLSKRDGLGISNTDKFNIKALENSYVLCFEVPE